MRAAATSSDGAPALVFLHGFALDARMWRRQVDLFSRHHRIVCVDLPGFGAQARELGPVDAAAGVIRALDVAKVSRAHLVSFSFSGAVAVDFALRFPERVASLTLIAPLMLGRRTGIESWARCVALAEEGDRTTALEIWLDDPLFEGLHADEELFEEVRQIVLDYGCGHWTGKVETVFGVPDPGARLSEITVPSLLISGEADLATFMVMAEAYAKALPHARREIVPAAGHCVTLERPDAFNAILMDFLGSL